MQRSSRIDKDILSLSGDPVERHVAGNGIATQSHVMLLFGLGAQVALNIARGLAAS